MNTNASWKVQAFEGDLAQLVIVEGETCVAECFVGDGGKSAEKAITNARLIAAAPELFAALEAILNAGDLSPDLILMSERAIDKARGLFDLSTEFYQAAKPKDENNIINRVKDTHLAVRWERDHLRAFAREVMSYWPEGGVDVCGLQKIALKYELLFPRTVHKPCSENGCYCAAYASPEKFKSGVVCLRKTNLLTGENIK